MTLLRDLIDIPEKVTPGDLVMELAYLIDVHDARLTGTLIPTPLTA